MEDSAPHISEVTAGDVMDDLIKRIKEKAEDPLLAVFPFVRSLFYEAIGMIERQRDEKATLEREIQKLHEEKL